MKRALVPTLLAFVALAWLLTRSEPDPAIDVTVPERPAAGAAATPDETVAPPDAPAGDVDAPRAAVAAQVEAPGTPAGPPKTVRVSGTVRARPSGAPIEGSVVWLNLGGPGTDAPEFENPSATTDASGRYAVEGQAGAILEAVSARAPRPPVLSDAPWQGSRPPRAHLGVTLRFEDERLTEDRAIDLEVDPGLHASGRVVDARTRAPIEGAWVGHGLFDCDLVVVRTNALGEFVIGGIKADDVSFKIRPWPLVARHEDHGEARFDFTDRAKDVPLEDVELGLSAGVFVSGRTVTPTDEPIEGVEVELIGWGEPSGLGPTIRAQARADAPTDSEGRFRIGPVPPSRDLIVRPSTSDPTHGCSSGVRVDAMEDVLDLRIEMEPAVEFVVLARGPALDPFPPERVEVVPLGETGLRPLARGRGALFGPSGVVHRVRVVACDEREDGAVELFRAEADAFGRAGDDQPISVEVVLDSLGLRAPIPAPTSGALGLSMGACELFVLDLVVVDASSGASLPAGAGFGLRFGDAMYARSTMGEGGRVRLTFPLGRDPVRFEPDGLQPVDLLLERLEPGYREFRLELPPKR